MNPQKFSSVFDWYNSSRERGFTVPISLCHELSCAMDRYGLPFPTVFKMFEEHGLLRRSGKHFEYIAQ